MAYVDEMALEREKSKQALLAGKQPLLGADTSAALHQLGVNLGVVPPGTPPSQMTALMESIIKRADPKDIKVDAAQPLQVQPNVGRLASVSPKPFDGGDELGGIVGNINAAKGSMLQKMLEKQQALPPVGGNQPARTGGVYGRAAAGRAGYTQGGRAAPSEPGPTYVADLEFLNSRGGHASIVKDGKIVDVPINTAGAYGAVDPELAARLRAAGEAYEKENPGKRAKYGEFSRGNDVQKIYRDRYEATGKGIAARPGESGHQHGRSGDLPPGEFRDWLYKNKDAHGVHFPVKGDAPHVEVNPRITESRSNPGQHIGSRATAAAASGQSIPATPPAGGAAAPAAGGNAALAQQRSANKAEATANPALREQMAAIMLLESSTPEGRQGTAEAIMNRVNAKGQALQAGLDPAYHKDYMIDNKPKYQAALDKIRNDPALRAQLYGEQDKAFNGSNVSNLATDYSSGATAAKGRANSTPTYQSPDGQSFFRKDINPNEHGAGNVAANKNWHAKTTASMGQAAPAAPSTITPQPAQAPSTPAPQAAPQPAPQPAPQASPQPAQPAKPAAAAAPAPAATPSPAAAAAPAPPPAAATPPASKPAPQVNPAHAILDTKIVDLVKRGDPSKVSQIPSFLADKTLREGMNMPMVGGRIAEGVKPYLKVMGVTPEQFDSAVKEGAPKAAAPSKRSDLPADLPRYAQADTGTVSDAMPEQPTAAEPGAEAPAQEVAPAAGNSSEAAAVGPEAPSEAPLETPKFDPEGTDYDMAGALKAGLRADDTGHWQSRDPQSGLLLKGAGHETWPKTVEGERAAGMEIYKKDDGRYYSRPAEQQPQQPSLSPEMAQALTNAFSDQLPESPAAPAPPPPVVTPPQPDLPSRPGAPSGAGLSLAPAGLMSVPTGALAPTPGSQGGAIAMAGMLPPIQNSTFSTPLIDQTAANTSSFGASSLSPIPFQTLNNWGWGGGSIGSGFDWGGGAGNSGAFDFAGGFTPPTIG